MIFVALGLGLLVVWLAVKSPDPNDATTSVGPNDNVPALGNVPNPSPATAGGSPTASTVYRAAMTANYTLPGSGARKVSAALGVKQLNAPQGTFVAPSATVAEMSKALMTQAAPTLPATPAMKGTAPPVINRIKL